MPRRPRSHQAPASLQPNPLYHVTNRGVNHSDLFHSDLDRLLFLSMLADACRLTGALCHCFCL